MTARPTAARHTMQATEQRALLTIALLAAFADGEKADTEREEIKRIADSLAGESGTPALAGLYQDVLLKRVNVAQAAAALPDEGQRLLAYEMAVCVCDADGAQSPAEQAFLSQLKSALKLGRTQTAEVEREADAIAAVPVTVPPPLATATPAPAAQVPTADLDSSILNHSILNGALELLPQSWASMAIIPLQMKLVYRIGQAHGYELDKGHIKEFIAAAGVGLTSQYVEQFGRKLLGGLLGKVGGGLGRGLGSAATGMAFSFASTYALGHLAKRYYAGGRQMSTAMLQETFQSLLQPAKQLQTQYLPQIQQKARTLDAGQILQMVKSA
ncbi:MAG: YcjF family protein [Aquincola tertiaricarbonis]